MKGFTFIELLVVITIVAVVFSAGVVSYTTINKNSRDARRKSDMEGVRQALEMCRAIAGEYPATIYPSVVCTDSGNTVTMETTPHDPKPCEGFESGEYSYSQTGGYRLTANCMEQDSLNNFVTNP